MPTSPPQLDLSYINVLGPLPQSHVSGEGSGGTNDAASGFHDHLPQPAQTSPEDTESALDRLFGGPSGIENDPTLAVPNSDGQDGRDQVRNESYNPLSNKRKATSRANMLARGGACEFCKRRKLKCTAEIPSCSTCVRAGRECVYSQKQQRSRVKVLEERLVELEKRLDVGADQGETPEQGMYRSPATTVDPVVQQLPSSVAWSDTPDWSTESFYTTPTPAVGFTLPDFDLTVPGPYIRDEPDLMTLADAATADARQVDIGRWPWDGMSVESIAAEIVKAVEGGKGVGEKILGHLLQLYVGPPSVPYLHYAVPPATFMSRLSSGSTSPPHPTLIYSILPFLLPISPSTALSSSPRQEQLSSLLQVRARDQTSIALSTTDPRLLDVVAACTLSNRTTVHGARFLEGWGETSGGIAMAWAAGLGKLGGVGLQWSEAPSARSEKLKREKNLREIRYKGTTVEPPKDGRELGERILLFWQVYLRDKASSIGWNFPSSISDEEITTPWPRDDYTNPEVLRDNRSMKDLFDGRAHSGAIDTDYCAQMKSLTLMCRATRLFDLPESVATPERTSQLIRVTRSYMSSLRSLTGMPLRQRGADIGPLNQAWMTLHATMMLLHAKEEIDAPLGAEAESLAKAIDAAAKVVDAVELAYSHGDSALDGYDIFAAVIWHVVGRTMYKYAERPERNTDQRRAANLRDMGADMSRACETLGRRFPFATVLSQLLENLAVGTERKLGEWARPDYHE